MLTMLCEAAVCFTGKTGADAVIAEQNAARLAPKEARCKRDSQL